MLRAEISLLFRRMRIKVLLGVLMLVPVIVAVAVRLSGTGPNPGEGPQFLAQVTHNGVFAALVGLTITLPIFLPLAVAVVSGDTIAGEANLGTLRYVLARPCGRTRLLVVKGVTVLLFCVVAALTVAIAGLLAGAVLFPIGSLTTLSGTTLPLVDGTLRILVAAVIVGGSLVGLAAIGMFVSTATDAPVGAMAATAGVAVLSGVLDAIPQLHALHPWLLTHWWLTFGDLFRAPVIWTGILKNAGVQAIYGVIFATAAWARFSNKDVLA